MTGRAHSTEETVTEGELSAVVLTEATGTTQEERAAVDPRVVAAATRSSSSNSNSISQQQLEQRERKAVCNTTRRDKIRYGIYDDKLEVLIE